VLRVESKRRARALQMLYACETGGANDPAEAAVALERLTGPEPAIAEPAQLLAERVLAERARLDALAASAAEHWRLERIGLIERNILRLGIFELLEQAEPPRVVLDQAVWLAHRFAGPRAPSFINGVLDRVARDLGRL
jgi:N utilization substance protein B